MIKCKKCNNERKESDMSSDFICDECMIEELNKEFDNFIYEDNFGNFYTKEDLINSNGVASIEDSY